MPLTTIYNVKLKFLSAFGLNMYDGINTTKRSNSGAHFLSVISLARITSFISKHPRTTRISINLKYSCINVDLSVFPLIID